MVKLYGYVVCRRFLVTIICTLSVFKAFAQEPQPTTTFIPDKRIHDFGTIFEKKGKVKHTFVFRNSGKSPVVINSISAWCGCTTASYTKQPIPPNTTGKVTVTFNPDHRSGNFSKEIAVITNSGKNYTRVWVKGKIVPYLHPVTEDHPYAYGNGLYMSHKVVAFPPLKKSEHFDFVLRIANSTNKTMTIDFKRNPNNRVLKMAESVTLKPNERTTLHLFYVAPKTYYYNRKINIVPIVNGKRSEVMRMTWQRNNR